MEGQDKSQVGKQRPGSEMPGVIPLKTGKEGQWEGLKQEAWSPSDIHSFIYSSKIHLEHLLNSKQDRAIPTLWNLG